MPLHKDLIDSELHELKGVNTALVNEVPVANGAGASVWKYIHTNGWEYVANTGSPQSLTNGSYINVTNNANSLNDFYRLSGKSAVWDNSNHEFDWAAAGYAVGDMVTIRLDVSITTVNAGDNVKIALDIADGSGSEIRNIFFDQSFAATGTYVYSIVTEVPLAVSAQVTNPTKVVAYTNGTGNTLTAIGWYVKVHLRNPIFV